ncbi:uncharacterized protein LOC119385864, partial [Rhipicephalus sanguineus]|uniref:uncharacterized protein LOC119385864 n=1 Tax=Rhipicephalus sanguineus TaxID=34632 RepID=UPI0020C58A74
MTKEDHNGRRLARAEALARHYGSKPGVFYVDASGPHHGGWYTAAVVHENRTVNGLTFRARDIIHAEEVAIALAACHPASQTIISDSARAPRPPSSAVPGRIVTLATSTVNVSTQAIESGKTTPPASAAMPLYGRLEPFEGDGSAWPIYEEQVHVFFRANDTPEEKQRDIFLASCGTQVFSLLLDLLKPATPHTKTLSELLTTLRSHFSPASSTLMERFRFNNRSRREGESLGQFVAALRGLASTCAFGDQLDSLLRDRFVCGINSPAMQTRLLELPDPSLDDVVKAALAMDAATKDAGEIARAASTEAAVNKMVARDGICSRCGDAHSPSQCQFVHSQCFTCGKTGHLARVCRTGKQNSAPQQQPGSSPGSTTARGQGRRRKWRRGRAAAGSGSSAARLNVVSENPPIFDMWHTGLVPSSVPPYVLTVEVCGRPISMELDTGASVSVMAGKLFKRTFPGVAVEASGVMLRSYSGELSQVEGQAQVSVRFGNREATLPLYLTKGSSPTLLGRNWICALGVRLPEGQEAALHGLQDIPSLLTDFQSLFQPGVGTFAGTTAGIHVPEGVQPRFFKPRPLPFALKDGVTQELQRLQREGILVPVKTAEWAAPIVPVPKRDGSVRICGDFKVTINPVATVEKYPLPRIEDLWSALSGGQKFTKLDLRDAYQQLVLQEASRKYVTISTTMGLFQYTRLPFGVTSAPAIFQREMDNLFRGMKHVAVYLDDILVTGIDDGDHMQNLHTFWPDFRMLVSSSSGKKKDQRFQLCQALLSVKDYESATRHLAEYLAVNDKQASAHKLMGEIHEAAGRLKQALQSYKHSLALEENQKDVVLKICEIHCELPADQETTKYWLERAESLFPGHRIIFKLKESLTRARGEPDVKDMENLITSELVTRPLDVALRVKLLRLLLNSGRVLDAYKHALQAEEEPQFGAEAFYSLPWQRCLADVFEAYQENQAGPVDESFLAKYLLTLDQLASLALTNPSSSAHAAIPGPLNGESAKQGERAAVEDAISAIESLDGLLDKAHKKKWTRGGAWDFVLHHVTGQLYLHMATLLLKRAWKENYNWQEARSWAAAMLLSAYSLRPPTGLSQESWFLALDSARQRLYRHVFLRAHHRLSVSGHIVHVLCEVESKSRWLSDLKQEACTPEVRKKIYRSLFDGEGTASWFLHDPTLVKCAFEFPTIAALQEHDQESQWLHPSSLNHLVWLALHWSSIQDKKFKGTEHFFEVRVFERLQREPHAFNSGAAETLSQMDTLAFLEATRYCAAQSLGRKSMRPSQGPLALPPHVGVQLCTGPQAEWWNAAYRLHTSTARDRMADYRRLLQRGLEVIRGIGNHGMDLTLVVRLARTFANRSSSMRADGLEEESKALEDRAAHYWEVVISMLEKSGSPSSPLSASRRLFCVPAGAVTLSGPQETRALKQEAKMFLAVRAMNAGCLDEAAEMLSQLTTAQAAFYTALVMKKMAQRESPQRGVQHALLQRERAALQLALERGRREPDQALASAVRAQLDDLEGRLVNISNGSFSDEAAETSWAPDVTSTPRSTHVSFARRPQQSSTPQVDRSFYPSRADVSHSSVSEQAESPTRQPRGQTAGSAASAAANEFVELQLRSLSLHQELVMSHLRQVLETNQNVLRELRDSHQAVLAEVKQQQTALEQLTKKVDDVATRAATAATASRAQRQREEADYVEEYTAAYESEYDPYTEYSHLEAAAASGAGPPHPVPPPAPLGYPPQFRGAPYASYPPPPPHLGYPLAPPPPLGRPLPPPLAPPQPFYSPQVAAAAAAVTTPGLCLAEGQPLPQFSFDISQPPPPTSVASSTSSHVASGDVGRVSAFSRLSKVPPPPQATMPTPVVPPVSAITPAAPALPPKPPNAPH